MGVTLETVQNDFVSIIGRIGSEPFVLSQFAIWLDLRLAEYKAKGVITLECSGESPDPNWLKGHNHDADRINQRQTTPEDFPSLLQRNPSASRETNNSSILEVTHTSGHGPSNNIVVVKAEPADLPSGDIFPIDLVSRGDLISNASPSRKRTATQSFCNEDRCAEPVSITMVTASQKNISASFGQKVRRLTTSDKVPPSNLPNESLLSIIGEDALEHEKNVESTNAALICTVDTQNRTVTCTDDQEEAGHKEDESPSTPSPVRPVAEGTDEASSASNISSMMSPQPDAGRVGNSHTGPDFTPCGGGFEYYKIGSWAESSDEEDLLGFTYDDISINGDDLSYSESSDEEVPLLNCTSSIQQECSGDGPSVNHAIPTATNSNLQTWQTNFTGIRITVKEFETGPVNTLQSDKNELDFLNLLFPDHLYDVLTEETNRYANQCMEIKADSKWKPVDKAEMKAFIGLHVVMSVVQLPTYKQYWSTDDLFQVPSIPSIMTRNRFERITQYFHCNDSARRTARNERNHDKIHHVRPIFDAIQQRLTNSYRPHKTMSIAEATFPFRGTMGYRQYLPSKLCKFNIKVWELADSTNGYVYQMRVHTGKKDTGKKVGLASRIVKDLTRVLSGRFHHVYMDSFFSSPALFEDLLADGIYAAGTCHIDRKGWPDALHEKCIAKGESKACQKGNVVATSWYDDRQVNFLSTNSDPAITMPLKQKQKDGSQTVIHAPEVVVKCAKYMNTVGHGDQLHMQYPSCKRFYEKFWNCTFWYLFDTALACAFILMKESPYHLLTSRSGQSKQRGQLEFRQNLAKQLIGQYRKKISRVSTTDKAGNSHWLSSMNKKGRCKNCSRQKIRRESIYGCKICNVNLCIVCFPPYHMEILTKSK